MLQQDAMATPYIEEQAGLDPWQYIEIVRKRILFLLVPFILVLGIGAAAAWFWPATYSSEGKILVESQQIPTDLVKPTVTASAKERLEVIQQRVMTRSNLLSILDKYNLYSAERDRLSRTELLDLMKQNTVITPVDIQRRGQSDTIAMTVGFMDRSPDIATKVANDLITLFLNEDARTRTNRASETARFLGREVERLKGELTAIDKRIADANLTLARAKIEHPAGSSIDSTAAQLSALRAQLAEKSAVFSTSHPEIKRLKAQIAALEKTTHGAAAPTNSGQTGGEAAAATAVPTVTIEFLDAVQKQRDFVQKSLDEATQKFAAAQMGEKLERDQYSERLEVLEQAIAPQKPVKPNRGKILGLSVIGAVMAAFAGVFAIETFDRTIRGSRDLLGVADSGLLVTVPYIWTKAEKARRRRRTIVLSLIALAFIVGAVLAVHFLIRPLDELWPILIEKIRTKLSMI
jgi:uncharacterized protein involved in exopolysaccharide biosynthesis